MGSLEIVMENINRLATANNLLKYAEIADFL